MIAKLICHAENREGAIQKMIRAIDEYEITGLETTLGFCRFVMTHEAFTSGNFDTRFIENYFNPGVLDHPGEEEEIIAAALAVTLMEAENKNSYEQLSATPAQSNWKKRKFESS
jgi:acetyl-CoA carboxylase biotin carboxylase subunit